ncbi:MAG: NAD(P)/FAD-dependent oxidoreductase [Thermoleophilia bacterium]|nr:NAD(P)/FAD-dependent oxidoreductase [Thermoleophilia bacterium]
MKKFELVVVGGGLASARAIKAYREAGGGGRIALVSRDDSVPYHRPPLSKRYLRGETDREGTLVEPESFYADQDVELLLSRTVEAVRPAGRRVELASGETLSYDKLLLAPGAFPRRLDVPGADLDGVFTLRTLDDATRIRDAAAAAGRAVAVGGSFIGMETAASLRTLGVEVALVELAETLFPILDAPELSRGLADLYRDRGVELVLGESVASFRGDGRLEAVETAGGRMLPADLAVVGIGVVPQTAFLEGSGIELDNGIVVDQSFRTSAPDVWAAGDAARFDDPVFGRARRIEHWSNANYQGTEVGKAIAGADGRYDSVSTFFTEVFGVTIKVFGDTSQAEGRTFDDSLERFLALYVEDGRLAGAVLSGQDAETEERLKRPIRAHVPESEVAR